MGRESYKSIERAKKIASMSMEEQRQYLESEKAPNRQSGASLPPRTCSAMNRWQLARMERQYMMLSQCEHAQEERIAAHYSAFAHMAMQLRMLCEERRVSGSIKLDETIKYLTDKIREGHQMEFGILLEWPNTHITQTEQMPKHTNE
ncbi:MAG: hypothetical protein KGL39_26440 [Patescibacteria group bacterium]|nr:hypothetical protein [Patescibacteria group bacterium]